MSEVSDRLEMHPPLRKILSRHNYTKIVLSKISQTIQKKLLEKFSYKKNKLSPRMYYDICLCIVCVVLNKEEGKREEGRVSGQE